jgi:hypothetical protein
MGQRPISGLPGPILCTSESRSLRSRKRKRARAREEVWEAARQEQVVGASLPHGLRGPKTCRLWGLLRAYRGIRPYS